MSKSLFNVGLSGLNAAMWGLTTIGQNISNVATPGYSRVRPIYEEVAGHYNSKVIQVAGVMFDTVLGILK